MAEFEHRPHGWPQARRFVVARRFIQQEEAETTLFSMGRYIYRAWVTNMELTPAGIWHFYDGRAGMEPRIRELREDFALRKIPTASFAANALYLDIVRLAYNLVTAFQRNCLHFAGVVAKPDAYEAALQAFLVTRGTDSASESPRPAAQGVAGATGLGQ